MIPKFTPVPPGFLIVYREDSSLVARILVGWTEKGPVVAGDYGIFDWYTECGEDRYEITTETEWHSYYKNAEQEFLDRA